MFLVTKGQPMWSDPTEKNNKALMRWSQYKGREQPGPSRQKAQGQRPMQTVMHIGASASLVAQVESTQHWEYVLHCKVLPDRYT